MRHYALRPDEQSRLLTRALARWLTSGGSKLGQFAGLDTVTARLQDDAGHLCAVVVAADGHVVARYRVVARGQNYRLSRKPHDPAPSAPLPAEQPVPWDRLGVLAWSADLRGRSAALTSRSADLRSHSAAIRVRVAATLPTVMRD